MLFPPLYAMSLRKTLPTGGVAAAGAGENVFLELGRGRKSEREGKGQKHFANGRRGMSCFSLRESPKRVHHENYRTNVGSPMESTREKKGTQPKRRGEDEFHPSEGGGEARGSNSYGEIFY